MKSKMLENITKNKILTKNFKLCRGMVSKARGLMFSKPHVLIFVFNKERRIALHMFFVFFPIDVVFLDGNKRVVDIKRDFKPFTFYKSKKMAKYVIELPLGIIGDNNIRIGDKLKW